MKRCNAPAWWCRDHGYHIIALIATIATSGPFHVSTHSTRTETVQTTYPANSPDDCSKELTGTCNTFSHKLDRKLCYHVE
eukprot:5556947-Amphidinium_carterae.1